MDLLKLEEIEQSGVRMIRTRDFRIDEYKSGGDARLVGNERQEQRVEAHAQRIQTELALVESN